MSLMEEYQRVEKELGLIVLDDPVLRFQGKDLSKFLQGMLSNDIQVFKEGKEFPACFLTAKGKWIAALHLFKVGDSIFAKTSPLEAQNLLQTIQPLILFSESQVMDVSQDYQWILGIGGSALQWMDGKFPHPVFQHTGFRLPSFLILCPRQEVKIWMEPWNEFLISPETLEVLRIESCIPIYGKDVDEKTIPLEAGLDSYFSYTKGCYVGQETISRIKHYGKVNKKLVKLKCGQEVKKDWTVLLGEKEVGKITSICNSPLFGTLALATLHQEAKSPGTEVWVCSKEEKIKAQVLE